MNQKQAFQRVAGVLSSYLLSSTPDEIVFTDTDADEERVLRAMMQWHARLDRVG